MWTYVSKVLSSNPYGGQTSLLILSNKKYIKSLILLRGE